VDIKKTDREGRCIAPLIVNLGTRRRQMVSFKPQVLYPLGRTLAPTEYDAEWGDLRSSLDILNRSNIYCSCQESKRGWSRL